MRCPRRIYLPEDLRRGSSPTVYAIVSFYLSSDIVENATNTRLAGWGNERKKEGKGAERRSRRYEKPPPPGIELWLPARLRSKSDSAPSLSEYNCIYLDSPDWIIGERGERETLLRILPTIEHELKHFASQWEFTQLSGDSVPFVISPSLLRNVKRVFHSVSSHLNFVFPPHSIYLIFFV